MNKRIYLGLSILDVSKILIYQFWYDYIQLNYGLTNNNNNNNNNNVILVNSLKKDLKEFVKSNKLMLKTQQKFKSEINVTKEDIREHNRY